MVGAQGIEPWTSPVRRERVVPYPTVQSRTFPICRWPRHRIWRNYTASSGRQRGLGIPSLPAAMAENLTNCTTSSATQCRSNPVSGRDLPKTGVFQMSAGDYRLFRSENAQNRSPETGGGFAKARHWRAFLRVSGTVSPSAGLPGWRRSADRTRLQPNSLLTGNFTGKIAFLGFQRQSRNHKSPSIRRFLSIFPTRIIREINSRNSEFSGSSRELGPNIRLDVQLFSKQPTFGGASNGGFAPQAVGRKSNNNDICFSLRSGHRPPDLPCPKSADSVAKTRFCEDVKNSEGRRRGFRVEI